jgi:hypothetical protein
MLSIVMLSVIMLSVSILYLSQGTLTEGGSLSVVDLIKVACLVKKLCLH